MHIVGDGAVNLLVMCGREKGQREEGKGGLEVKRRGPCGKLEHRTSACVIAFLR